MKPTITAILLPEGFTNWLISGAMGRNLHEGMDGRWHCHHVTLAFNKPWNRQPIGSYRKITLTHYGIIPGRVMAFRVEGADDSHNKTPHITGFVANGAKPVESNLIDKWIPLKMENAKVVGRIQLL